MTSATPNRRLVGMSILALTIGAIMAPVAQFLLWLISAITSLAFFGQLSHEELTPIGNTLGPWVIVVPMVGALIVGLMARYGSPAIRGHGIPEAMEQVLENSSRIPARITWLKPLSAAISIGTGGPFGAEGPIIATGGAGGSLLGQLLPMSPTDRKTLLAAGAAAGMAATFGSPLSAVLLAIELLLFEFKARSIVPVTLAVSMATAIRSAWIGSIPVFSFPNVIEAPSVSAFFALLLIAAFLGVLAFLISRVVYVIEDGFEKLPIHWMWWPALGAIVVGVIGYVEPRTLGVGYGNITANLAATLPAAAVLALCGLKFLSWSVALGSGTSGGTLAPLMTFGSGLGLVAGMAMHSVVPELDIHLAALVGMACVFGGASQAMLASAVFAYETTGQSAAIFPLLACSAVTLVVVKAMGRTSIMTEKIERRGISVPSHFVADVFEHTSVAKVMETNVISVLPTMALDEFAKMATAPRTTGNAPHAYPVVGANEGLIGVITLADLTRFAESDECAVSDAMSSPAITVRPTDTLHEAVERMLTHGVGRLPVVSPDDPTRLVGFLSRRTILGVRQRLIRDEALEPATLIPFRKSPTSQKADIASP